MNKGIATDTEASIESELLKHGCYASNTIGTSMRPLFAHHRDMVVLVPLTAPLKKRDIILYPDGRGNYILHRIIGIREDVYVVRGDNTYAKEYVPKSAVVAVLSEYNRKGKHHRVSDFSHRLYSFVWCAIYPVRHLWRSSLNFARRVYRKIFPKKSK